MGDAQAARDVVRIPTVMGGDARSEERGRGTGELVGWQMQVGRLKGGGFNLIRQQTLPSEIGIAPRQPLMNL